MKVQIGNKIKVPDEKRRYTVQARDDRYIIATKWLNLHDTVSYFIIDLEKKWRAPDNRIFCEGYETQEQCEESLEQLQNGELELSQRHGIPLDIEIE